MQKIREENGPFVQILMLVIYAILGLILVTALGFALVYLNYGGAILANMDWMSGTDPYYLPAQRILLTAQQIGLFLVPALLLAKTEGKKINVFYGFKKVKPEILLIVLLLMICTMPVLEWITEFNQKMVLPEAFKALERWMKAAEDQGMETTMALLKMDHIGIFILNLGMIALLPAIAEELMFRGALQRSMARMFNNPHVAIWFSAFIFSAIHMQFYGFLPRLFLGAAFGYCLFVERQFMVCHIWAFYK